MNILFYLQSQERKSKRRLKKFESLKSVVKDEIRLMVLIFSENNRLKAIHEAMLNNVNKHNEK